MLSHILGSYTWTHTHTRTRTWTRTRISYCQVTFSDLILGLGLRLRLLSEFQFCGFVLGRSHLLCDERVPTSEERKKERETFNHQFPFLPTSRTLHFRPYLIPRGARVRLPKRRREYRFAHKYSHLSHIQRESSSFLVGRAYFSGRARRAPPAFGPFFLFFFWGGKVVKKSVMKTRQHHRRRDGKRSGDDAPATSPGKDRTTTTASLVFHGTVRPFVPSESAVQPAVRISSLRVGFVSFEQSPFVSSSVTIDEIAGKSRRRVRLERVGDRGVLVGGVGVGF